MVRKVAQSFVRVRVYSCCPGHLPFLCVRRHFFPAYCSVPHWIGQVPLSSDFFQNKAVTTSKVYDVPESTARVRSAKEQASSTDKKVPMLSKIFLTLKLPC